MSQSSTRNQSEAVGLSKMKFAIFLICAFLFASTEALKCKFCQDTYAACSAKGNSGREEDCSSGNVCVTIKWNDTNVYKTCLPEGRCEVYYKDCHECKTDLCNSVGKVEATVLVSIAMLFITKWIV